MKLIPAPQWISIIVMSMLAEAICHLLGSCLTYEEQVMPDDEKARLNNEKLAKDKKKGKIIIIIGVVLVIASFVVL